MDKLDALEMRLHREFEEYQKELLSHKSEYILEHSYETAIKLEIVNCDLTSLKYCVDSLLKKENTLEYLYSEYIDDDFVNVAREIEGFFERLAYIQSNIENK